MVCMSHIAKEFGRGSVNEKTVFTDFSLTIRKGDFVSVIGSNGSGKTTMLNLLCGSIPADSGTIEVGGQRIDGLREHQRARFIGRVFQDPQKGSCASLTILENMALADNKGGHYFLTSGVNRKRTDAYRAMLEPLGLGLENHMGVQVGSLSGGQRQALALLISTMTPIDLLILDEHTASLDPRSSETVMELTEKVVREKRLTTLMVTHNLRYAVQYGNRLLMMHQGQAVVDVADEEKDSYSVDDLLAIFNEISIEVGN
ncbi:ATP-binding cassette domain-containing protein, partial [Eubacteriales bacterium OttesenSCG-928-A19]|nr:ATP-binding cassette domain-containing protein [Eubacteriales bacterium OttesenSCG-928-A19]